MKRLVYLDGIKICTLCKENKPLSEFYIRKNGQPQPSCKKCKSLLVYNYYKKNGYPKEKRKTHWNKWANNNRGKILQKHKKISKRERDNLSDGYIASLLSILTGVERKILKQNKNIIIAKRETLKIKRLIKNEKSSTKKPN
jgi:hypothetical protein